MSNTPFTGAGLYKLRSNRKIELPQNISSYAKWCARDQRHECLGMVLDRRCLSIFPPKYLRWREQMLENHQLTPEHAGTPRAQLLRVLARSRPLTISEKGLLGVPKDLTRLGLLPAGDDAWVEVVAFGEIIELWNPDRVTDEATIDGARFPELLRQLDLELPGDSWPG